MYTINELEYDGLGQVSLTIEDGLTAFLSADQEALNHFEAIVSGRKKPEKGSIETDGEIGYMPQGAPVYADMTVKGWMLYMGQLRGSTKEEVVWQAEELLQKYRLEDIQDRYMGKNMKAANRFLAAMVQTMMGHPSVLLLNLSFENLDVEDIERMKAMLMQMKEEYSILVFGLDVETAGELADHVYFLEDHKLDSLSAGELIQKHQEYAMKTAGEDDLQQILENYEKQ